MSAPNESAAALSGAAARDDTGKQQPADPTGDRGAAQVTAGLPALQSRDRRILELSALGCTLQKIADDVGLTRERVRQILLANGSTAHVGRKSPGRPKRVAGKIQRYKRKPGGVPTQIWLDPKVRAQINLVAGDQNCSMGDLIVFALTSLFTEHFPWVLAMPEPPKGEPADPDAQGRS